MSAKQPYGAWVRVDLISLDGESQLYQAALRPWADAPAYYDGYKKKRLLSVGDSERMLSDPRSGEPEIATFTFVIFDKDGFWRSLLADPMWKYLTSKDVTYFFASEQAHAQQLIPRVEFRGQVKSAGPQPGRKFYINGESRIGTRYGPWNIDRSLLSRVYSNVDFRALPRDFEGRAVPGLWGEASDLGFENAAGEDISEGVITPTFCGEEFQGTTVGDEPIAPELLPPPLAPTVVPFGAGGSSTWTYVLVAEATYNAGTTTIGDTTTVSGLPATFSPTNGATITPVDYGVAKYDAEVAAYRLYVKEGEADSENDWHFLARINAAYTDDGTVPHDVVIGENPEPPCLNTAQLSGENQTPGASEGSGFFGWYNLLMFTGKIIDISGLQPGETGDARRTKVTTAEIGTDFLLGPGNKGITRVINGRTYFGFWAKGPRAEAHKSGQMPLQVNMCGRHENHDNSLAIIDQAAYVFLDVLVQTSGEDGNGYQTGPPLGIPSFQSAPSIPMFQTTTFEAVQNQGISEMGTAKGPLTCVYIDSLSVTRRSFIAKFCKEYGYDWGENQQGQQMIASMDDNADPTVGVPIRERVEIRRVEDAGMPNENEIINEQTYEYIKNFATNVYHSGKKTIRDDDSIRGYNGVFGDTMQMDFVRDHATANYVAAKRLARFAIAPSYPALSCRFKGVLNLELGDQALIQHSDLISSEPIPLYVRRRRTSQTRGEVLIVGRDRAEVLGQTFARIGLGDDSVPDDEIDDAASPFLLGDETSDLPYPIGALRLT